MYEIKYEILKHIATFSENPKTGWTKEFNIVSWNGRKPKYDIREWSPNHDMMDKGITLDEDEMNIIVLAIIEERRNEDGRINTNESD